MSRMLSDLLAANEPMFSLALKQLEEASGKLSVDVRLTAEILGKVQLKTKELGLDPHDTAGAELYHALLNKTRIADEHLVETIGGKDPEDVQALLPLMKIVAEARDHHRTAWVLKKSVAKNMLKKMPPRKVMTHLKYKSIDSMLKRENISEIYGALRFSEGPEWLNKFITLYADLRPSDFETRDIEIVSMSSERWGTIAEEFMHKKRHNITHLKELGVIVMLPTSVQRMTGITITVLSLLFHYLNEIRLYSAYFKLQQVKPNFGEIIVNTLIADPGSGAIMAGTHIHWRVIQRYFGKLENEFHPEEFEPHVQPEDLHWRRAEESLFALDSRLEFWRDLDFVAVIHAGRPITFNLMDNAIAYCTQTPYANRVIYHFREALWNEVFVRYMGIKTLEKQVLMQLDNEMIAPETL